MKWAVTTVLPMNVQSHTVYLDAFYMDIYEVTNAEYKAFIDANPEWQKDNIAAEYHDGVYLRLWEGNDYPEGKAEPSRHLCELVRSDGLRRMGRQTVTDRGGMGESSPRGSRREGISIRRYVEYASLANYTRHFNAPIAVGQYPPNGYGLYDMAGNISEWCLDEYDPNFYATSPRENPVSKGKRQAIIKNFRTVKEKDRILRGGCWSDNGLFLRVAYRDWGPQNYTSVFRGFRCVKDKL